MYRPLTSLLILTLAACRPPQPCPSCDEGDADDDEQPVDAAEEEEMPDLPCGGADLQNDDYNCGACENVCHVRAGGTDYEAGGCVAGACGPNWHGYEWLEPSSLTCDEICSGVTLTCNVNGCSGLTAFVCESVFGQPCDVLDGGAAPLLDFSGACDEPIPWPDELEFEGVRNAFCCCG